jgi:tetratricopeptide (TPR) repeat protein
MLRALSYLHRRRILHRDVKPSNILVLERKEGPLLKLLDFGLSIERAEVPTSLRAGTLAYMAPELFRGGSPSESSDLYAVGMVAAQILTGSLPFHLAHQPADAIRQILNEEPDLSRVPEPLRAVLAPTLKKHPKERPQEASALLRDLAQAAGLPIPSEPADAWNSYLVAAQFTGREAELERLRQALLAATQRQGSAWLLGGESGVGKSRLLEELRCHALLEGVLVVRSQAQTGGGSAYRLWQGVLKPLVLHMQLSDNEVSHLGTLLPELGTLLGRSVPPPAEADVQTTQFRTMHILREVLLRCREPVLVLLEDLQWADEESLTLLRQVAADLSTLPLMIVASYRDDEAPGLAHPLRGLQRLRLERLGRAQIQQLCESMLGERGKDPKMLDLVERETEGNTLFIVELLRALAEASGSLHAVCGDGPPLRALPGGIQQVFQKRLSRVPGHAWPTLHLAAVAGRELDEHLLAQTVPDLDADIHACAEVGVLEMHEQRWRFSHDKLREYVLAIIPAERLRTIHAQVARSLETTYPDPHGHAARIAYHHREARQLHSAARFYALAGEYALSRGAPAEAEAMLQQAAALHPKVGCSPFEKLQLWRALTQARFGLGQLQATDAALREVCALLGTPLPTDLRSWLSAMLREARIQLANRLRQPYPTSHPVSAPPLSAPDRELLAALTVQEIYVWLGRPELALLCTLWGLNLAEAAGEPARRSGFAAAWMFLLSYTPLRTLSIRWLLSLQSARSKTPADEISRLRVLAICWLNEGEWQLAADSAAKAVSVARSQSDDLSLMSCLLPLELARTGLDEYEAVLQICREMEQLAARIQNPRYTALALIGQGVARLRRGDVAVADALLQRASQQAELGYALEAVVHSLIALVSLQSGQSARATESADAAMQAIRRVRWPVAELRYPLSCALDVYLASPDLVRHQALVQEALAKLRQIALRFPFVASNAALYRARYAWRLGNHRLAAACFRESVQGSSQQGARFERAWASCWMGQFLTQTGSEKQRREGEAHLRAALAIFTQLGNVWDAEQARTCLEALR